MDLKITYSASDRLLRYVKIDTQSDPDSGTCPSTPGQKTLGALLVDELREIGLTDAEMDGNGYVYATIPSNTDKDVPVICLCAHMDTSPDCSGKDVNPVKHENYAGGDIILPADPTQVIKADDNPDLQNQLGHTVITADGTT
ncbi:MAG: peptidase T, partial [Flavobacteriales bacterium]